MPSYSSGESQAKREDSRLPRMSREEEGARTVGSPVRPDGHSKATEEHPTETDAQNERERNLAKSQEGRVSRRMECQTVKKMD